MNYDLERAKQAATDIRKAFRELFPLAGELDLPSDPSHIKRFLRDRIAEECSERVFHFQSRVTRILCEVSPPKTHIEDMCRIVVEEAKKARADRVKLEKAVEVTTERDEMLERLREIGALVGCNHVEDPDGRTKLVQCIEESLAATNDKNDSASLVPPQEGEDFGYFRKKPKVIRAAKVPFANHAVETFHRWAGEVGFRDWTSNGRGGIDVQTLEGTMTSQAGDWIICGIKGEFYPIKPDIFAESYERVSAPLADAAETKPATDGDTAGGVGGS